MHIGEPVIAAEVAPVELFVIEAGFDTAIEKIKTGRPRRESSLALERVMDMRAESAH
ncbi:MAG: hypothetical protein JNG86_11290 [Verrucomicrobiaceae bacterium]|nr:hypothetical protein [Verrucomicrobiaceae bacterium]